MRFPFLLSEQAEWGVTAVQHRLAAMMLASDEMCGMRDCDPDIPARLGAVFPLDRCGCGEPFEMWTVEPWKWTGRRRPQLRVCLNCKGTPRAKTAHRPERAQRSVAGRKTPRHRR